MNMKKFIYSTLAVLLFPVLANAQDYRVDYEDVARYGYERPLKCEMRFGIGGYPYADTYMFLNDGYKGRTSNSASDMEYIYADYYGPAYTTGSVSAEFNLLLKHWLNLSFTLSDCYSWRTRYDGVTDESKGVVYSNSLCFMPQLRFTYLSKRYVKLYSSIGAGVYAAKLNDEWKFGPAYEFCPIGVMTGRRVFGFTELGFGTRYVGLNAGIGFRF